MSKSWRTKNESLQNENAKLKAHNYCNNNEIRYYEEKMLGFGPSCGLV